MQNGGTMISNGSYSCIFKPYIPCEKERITKKTRKKQKISKVFVTPNSKSMSKKEYDMNQRIKQIKTNKKWAVLWTKKCKPLDYDALYKYDKDIHKCLVHKNDNKQSYNKHRIMLVGDYKGKDLFHSALDYSISTISSFQNHLLKICVSMKPLFQGLVELYTHKISHLDISLRNVVQDNKDCKYIDFGISSIISNKKYIMSRSKHLLSRHVLHIPSPLELLYLNLNDNQKKIEKDRLHKKHYRQFYNIISKINRLFFHFKELDDHCLSCLSKKYTTSQVKDLTSMIDTYSLGMLLPTYLLIISDKHKLKNSKIKQIINHPQIKKYLHLFSQMSHPDYTQRISPFKAYEHYTSI
jgi:hypothetical protein